MAKKTGLGKGLEALFSVPVEENTQTYPQAVDNGIVKLNIN